MRPSRSHSRRPISEPPRRPATAIRTPFAPAFIERWIACFIAFLNAMRRVSCWAMFIATRCASSSGWRISLISSLTLRLVSAPICWRRTSTFWPPLPMTMPGLAVCTVTVTWPKLRSISRPLTLAFARRLSTSWRIARSSLRRSVYSLSWYHFAVHVRVTPGIEDEELVSGHVQVVLGVRGRALQHAGHVLGGVLGHEPEQGRRLLHGAAADRL